MKKIFDTRLLIAALSIVGCTAAPVIGQAQYRNTDVRYSQDRRWDGNWQNRRPQPNRQWRAVDIKSLADRAERTSNSLRAAFERDFRRYDLDRLDPAENAKAKIQRMDENMERFRRAVDSRRPWSGRDELQRAISYAQDVRQLFARHPRIHETIRGHWSRLRDDLNRLADIYNIQGVDGRYR